MGHEESMPPFTAHVNNTAWLVTDRNHPQFGHLARILKHDWRESGAIYVQFADTKIEEFRTPLKREAPAKGKIFYVVRNEAGDIYDNTMDGPRELVKTFLELCVGDFAEFARRYKKTFGQDF